MNGMKLDKGFENTHTHNYGHDLNMLSRPEKNSHTCIVHGQNWAHWKWMGDKFYLVETFGTAAKQNLKGVI